MAGPGAVSAGGAPATLLLSKACVRDLLTREGCASPVEVGMHKDQSLGPNSKEVPMSLPTSTPPFVGLE